MMHRLSFEGKEGSSREEKDGSSYHGGSATGGNLVKKRETADLLLIS